MTTKQQHINAAAALRAGDPVRAWHLDAVAGIEVAEALGVTCNEAKPVAAELRPVLRAWHEAELDYGDPEQATEVQFALLDTLREYGFDRDPVGIVDGRGLRSWLEREYGQLLLDPYVRHVAALVSLAASDDEVAASSDASSSDAGNVVDVNAL